ncbi:hypothetical protein ACFYUY_01485 [Kitasatospora sp. NPDC004745]|uniref:hypothetical protein n=1 Tax=Kitasatospora sp. NPDC004745 TaxID=3364019 RepID=UPI0036A5874B
MSIDGQVLSARELAEVLAGTPAADDSLYVGFPGEAGFDNPDWRDTPLAAPMDAG